MNQQLVKLRFVFVSCLLLATVAFVSGRAETPGASATAQFETRCGWFSNPTPANASLLDSEAEWLIGAQGGYQAEGDWPDFGPKQWVETNGPHGYGCACLRLRVNRKTHEVIEIASARPRPLSVCRRDRSLRKWDFK